MLSSKANAALMRVKEIETKYKLKRKEQKWNREQESDSPISSVSINPSEKLFAETKQLLKNTAKAKLEIKIPNTYFEEDVEETNFQKNSSLDAINPKLKETTDKPELDTAILSENKSSPFIDKQESSNSTIQENSSIKDDNSSKSFSRSKTLQETLSKLSQHEEKSTGKYGKTKKSDKLSKSTEEAQSFDNSSNLKRSRESEKSKKKASKIYFDPQSEKHAIKQETSVKLAKIASSEWNSKRPNRSEFFHDNSIIEESISTIEDVSEIKSEMSPVDETIADKIEENSINVSKYSKQMVAQNASTSDSSSSKRLVVESQYANDTFENISSSPMRLNSELQSEKPIDEMKKIPDSALSNIKENNTSHKDISSFSKTLIVDATKSDDKSSSEIKIITSVRQDSDQEDYGKASKQETTKESTIDVGELPAMSDEDETVSEKSSLLKEENRNEYGLEKDADSQIHEDTKYAMRKLHRNVIDALAKHHVPITRSKKTSKSSTKSETETKARGVTKIRKKVRKEEETRHSSEKDEPVNSDNGCERSTKRRRKRPKVTNVKSTDARNGVEKRGKDKALKLNGKQMLRLQKRIVELRLREERESLQKYMNELRNSRPELDRSQTYFCPLEFPNIAGFTEPDVIDLESVDQRAMLQERVLAIRRWMKDQYILYHDYCNMARAINTHYTPTTLEDAKKLKSREKT
ncbi:putative leucine-rich repeat-containing protein DDB_G0290503 isoform X2 [Pseudomyrmex gracilis]|uniref:putative leucine-rich repeat-containing protein DDB_G0290503 isoform X2 n=1 Tax=Pseudomyrmex gracilis TaxID=219809 RepID=UPI000994C4DF|nr:putative leucine-rich repeat-containing protein DDB_G0290503 isoform X2 [Pseudomyrmex gracilis]